MADPKWLEEDKRRMDAFKAEDRPEHSMVMGIKRAHIHIAELRRVLEESRPWHVYCDDPWYSCPKAEDGCANPSDGDNCNCRADEKNAAIDAVLLRDEPPEVNDG